MYLGISSLSLTPFIAAQLSDRADVGRLDVEHGVFVVNVDSNSPASRYIALSNGAK